MPKITSKRLLKEPSYQDATVAGQLFDKIEGFAGYGFNKSHSCAYTLISYQTMWLKTYHPTEFFAAALSIMKEDHLPALLRDAANHGVSVEPPDINVSTSRFEIDGNRLLMPFQRIKGLSTKTAETILEARKAGPFTDKADFIVRVERRRCNARHQLLMDQVGAFARIEPGQVLFNHESRIKDQIELLPGLIAAHVPIHREMHTDRVTKDAIAGVVSNYRSTHGPAGDAPDGMPVRPAFGKQARIMLVSDAPNAQEDQNGVMGATLAASAVTEALYEAELDENDIYWTALSKRPKRGKQITPEEIAVYAPYLAREIEILQPTVIVLLGSMTVRHFFPGFKGKASDAAGKVEYDKDRDANVVIGFSPGEIYFAPEKQEALNEIFAIAANLLL